MGKKWSCGIRALPRKIAGDLSTPVTGVLWTCDGFIVHMSVLEGTSVDDLALRRSFERAVAEPAEDAPRGRPKRIRVAEPFLARRLRKLLPKVHVEVGPTPEIDEAFESIADRVDPGPANPIEEFMALDAVVRDALMAAALGLFDLRPWALFPPAPCVRVVIPSCGLTDGRLSLMGHDREVFGFMLFRTDADWRRFSRAMTAATGRPAVTCFSLNYEPIPASEISGDPTDEGDFPLPILTAFEADGHRPPDRAEAKLLIAATLGLARFMRRRAGELVSQSDQARGVAGKYRVEVLGEKLDVRVSFKR